MRSVYKTFSARLMPSSCCNPIKCFTRLSANRSALFVIFVVVDLSVIKLYKHLNYNANSKKYKLLVAVKKGNVWCVFSIELFIDDDG